MIQRGRVLALRLGVGALLCWAGGSKAGDPWAFAESIANYRLLPASANQMLAVMLPWWELSAGLLLILGIWAREAGLFAAALFGSFSIAVLTALARGLNIECGCFGGTATPVGLWTLGIDVAGLVGCVMLLRSERVLDRETLSGVPSSSGPLR